MSYQRLISAGPPVLLALAMLVAGAAPAIAQRPALRTFGVADGLPSEVVSALMLDSRGFLWVGHRLGVSRFDGTRFVNYGTGDGLPGFIVYDLLEDRAGRLWAATNRGGIARFEPDRRAVSPTGREPLFRTFPVGSNQSTNRVNAIRQDVDGRLWAATDGGLFRADDLDAPRFVAVPLMRPGSRDGASPAIARLATGLDGTVWLGSYAGVMARLADGSVVDYTGDDLRYRRPVLGLLVDDRGLVWAGFDIGLVVIKPDMRKTSASNGGPRGSLLTAKTCARDATGRWTLPQQTGDACRLPLPDEEADHDIRSVVQSADGRVIIGNHAGQIAEFDRGALRWIFDGRDRGRLVHLHEDRLGNLWTASLTHGLSRIARRGLVTYAATGARSHGVRWFLGERDGSVLFVTTDVSVYRLARDGAIRVPLPMPFRVAPPPAGTGLLDRDGDIWLGSGEGLFRFAWKTRARQTAIARTVYTTREGLPAPSVGPLFQDSRGDVWISTGSGAQSAIARWEAASGRIHAYPARVEGGRFSQVTAFAEDRSGGIWVSFRDGGLARVRGAVIEAVPGTGDLIAGRLYVDRSGRLWVNSFAGAWRFDDPAAARPRPVRYTTRDGLSTNEIRCFAEDRQGRIYVGTVAGLDRLDLTDGTIRHYGVAEGMPFEEVMDVFTSADGTVWVATPGAIASLTPDSDVTRARPRVRIDAMTVAGIPQALPPLGTDAARGFRFGPSQDRLQFAFFGLSPDLIGPLRYQYRLHGLDGEWTTPSRDRSVTYGSLAPGAYRFEVRALTAAGESSERTAVVSFEVLPPLWQRWWVVAIAAAAFSAAIYAGHRYRLSHILRLERVRNRIATDLHDDIGASLSQIAILSDLGRSRIDARDIEGASQRLTTIATTSRELIDTMSDIVWAVNPHRDSVDDLVYRMRRFAADSLESAGISLTFVAPEPGATMRLGPDVRREILLVLKECVTNIVRHARCTEAAIAFQVDGQRLRLCVRDNGRGFDAGAAPAGNGLRSMRRRVETLGGTFCVTSAPTGGAEIAVDLTVR